MTYPLLEMDRGAVSHNVREIARVCCAAGVDAWGVTKVVRGDPEIARLMILGGFAGLCDSRTDNIAAMRSAGVTARVMLIRVPMISEIRRAVELADVIMMSETSVIRAADAACAETGREVEILLTADVGDRREGFMPEEMLAAADELRDLRHVRVAGLAANFACASGVLATQDKFIELIRLRDEMRRRTGLELGTISVGGTTALFEAERRAVPDGITQFRIGEAVVAARDSSRDRDLTYLRPDAFTLRAEVVECRDKPSLPDGEFGQAAGGLAPEFEDLGVRRRALLALGKQDTVPDRLIPLDEGVKILGASGDHLRVDVTDRPVRTEPGDVLSFRPLYPALLALSTSPYVTKKYI